jgi:hypothetical protein
MRFKTFLVEEVFFGKDPSKTKINPTKMYMMKHGM